MKKIIILLAIVLSNYMYANTVNYNQGRALAINLLSSKDQSVNYNLYFNEVLKKCARISGEVHHMGDARLPQEICEYTLGFRDQLNGTTTSLSQCNRSSARPNTTYPSNLTLANFSSCLGNGMVASSLFCPAKNFNSTNPHTATVTYTAPSNYPSGVFAYVNGNQNGQLCAANSVYFCRIAIQCESTGVGNDWILKSESCNCISQVSENACSGTPPIGKDHCRCGKWVDWEKFRQTHEC